MSSISSQYPAQAAIADQYKAKEAQKEEIRTQNETEIENLKKAYALQKEDVKDRYESSLQNERQATYEHLRNTKSQLNREERALDALKNQAIGEKKREFTREEIETEAEGRKTLTDLRQKFAATEDLERAKIQQAEAQIRGDHHKTAEAILHESQKKVDTLRDEKAAYLENQKITHAQALNQIFDHYQDSRAQTLQGYQHEIQDLAHKTSTDINERRIASGTYIQNLQQKEDDPFYQLSRFDSQLVDAGDAYVLRVKAPEYERSQMRVQISGQEMQLSGVRTADNTVKLEEGRTVSSKSYQNITERFKLDQAVDPRNLSRREDGEWVEYRLPKFDGHGRSQLRSNAVVYDDPHRSDGSKELDFINTLPTPTIPAQARGRGTLGT